MKTEYNRQIDNDQSEAFTLRYGEWLAVWRGKLSRATFNSKGAALAWIASCNALGRFRS